MSTRRTLKLTLSVAMIAIAGSTLYPFWSHAGGGGMSGGALETTQLANNAELVSVVAKELEQIENQLLQIQYLRNSYENMLNQSKRLSDFEWTNAAGYLIDLRGVIRRTRGLYSGLGALDTTFRRQYPGYKTPAAQGYKDWNSYYRTQNDDFLGTIESTLKSHDFAMKDFETTGQTIRTIQSRAANAEGRNQILQASVDIASLTADQVGRLRQDVHLQTTLMAEYMAQERQREVTREAIVDERFRPDLSYDSTTYKSKGY